MLDNKLMRLNTVNRFLQMETSKDTELQQLVELASQICGSPMAMITLMDDETQHVRFKVGVSISEVPYQDTFCRYTVAQKEMLVITDATLDERVMNNKFVLNDPNIRFYAGAPLTTHDDLIMGTLCVYDIQPKILTPIQEKMLSRLAKQVTRLMEFDASLELLNEQHNYSKSEEIKLRSFFESTSSCHLLLDWNLRVIYFNKCLVDTLTSIYGLPIKEGMLPHEYGEPSSLEDFTRNCEKALKGEAVRIEIVVPSPKGDITWYHTYEPAANSEGNIIGVSFVATDISQTVKHEQTVNGQEESFRQIERIVSAELAHPIQMIAEAMTGLKQEGYPQDIMEFIITSGYRDGSLSAPEAATSLIQ
jgi:hypothetical protein